MEIRDEYRDLDALTPDPQNFNRHSTTEVQKLAARIQEVGFTNPFLCDATGRIAAGHRRRLALRYMRAQQWPEPAGVRKGWKVPCRVGAWSDLQRLKVLVGDNPDPLAIDYDAELLAGLLSDLARQDELDGTGYTEESLEGGRGAARLQPHGGARLAGPTKATKLLIAERRRKVAGLLTRRIPQQEIAKQLAVDPATVCRDVQAIMKTWQEELLGDIRPLKARESAELDQMERDVSLQYHASREGGWIDRRLKIKERRAKLLGLDAPVRQEVSGPHEGPISIAMEDAIARIYGPPPEPVAEAADDEPGDD